MKNQSLLDGRETLIQLKIASLSTLTVQMPLYTAILSLLEKRHFFSSSDTIRRVQLLIHCS